MNYEKETNKLTARLDNLQKAFEQAQKNQVPITAKTDDTAVKVEAVTPTTLTKTAYIDDTEVVFDAVGNITAYMVDDKGNSVPFTMTQADGKVRISFDKLDTTATVTINIL